MIKTYTKLMSFRTFDERLKYLFLHGNIGDLHLAGRKPLSDLFYRSDKWKHIRDEIIVRDNGCDLGIEDRPIYGKIIVHHMNPILYDTLIHDDRSLYDPDNLISVSLDTHNIIHFSDERQLGKYDVIERFENDTAPWRIA